MQVLHSNNLISQLPQKEEMNKMEKKKHQRHPIQKVGTYATRVSDLNGQGVE
jgi:hypothetical protein